MTFISLHRPILKFPDSFSCQFKSILEPSGEFFIVIIVFSTPESLWVFFKTISGSVIDILFGKGKYQSHILL